MDERKLAKLQKILEAANEDYASSEEVAKIFHELIMGYKALESSVSTKMDGICSTVEKMMSNEMKVNKSEMTSMIKELKSEFDRSIKEVNLKEGQPGKDAVVDYPKIVSKVYDMIEVPDPIPGVPGKDGSPDSGKAIVEKINALPEDALKIGKTHIEDFDFVSPDMMNRALSILDQRTSFLINKINNLQSGDSLPSQAGKNGKYLKTNGATASWEDVTSGGTPGGALTSLQFNDGGVFNGFGSWNKVTSTLAVGDNTTPASVYIQGTGDGGYLTQRQFGWKNYRGDLVGQLSDSGSDGDHAYGLFALGGNSTESLRLGELDFYDRAIEGDQRKGGIWGQYTTILTPTATYESIANYSGNFTYLTIVPGSITGNYHATSDDTDHTYRDDGFGILVDDGNYDSHTIGTIDYTTGAFDTTGYESDYIQDASYNYNASSLIYGVSLSGGGAGILNVDENGTTNISNYSNTFPSTLYSATVKIFASGAAYDQGAQLNWYDEEGNEMGSLGNYITNGYGTFLLEGNSNTHERLFDFTSVDRSLTGDTRTGTISMSWNGLSYEIGLSARISKDEAGQIRVISVTTDGQGEGRSIFTGKVLVADTDDNHTGTDVQINGGLSVATNSIFGFNLTGQEEYPDATSGTLPLTPIKPHSVYGSYINTEPNNYTFMDDGEGNLVDDGGSDGHIIGTIDYATGAWETTSQLSESISYIYADQRLYGVTISQAGDIVAHNIYATGASDYYGTLAQFTVDSTDGDYATRFRMKKAGVSKWEQIIGAGANDNWSLSTDGSLVMTADYTSLAVSFAGLIKPQQHATSGAPSYVKGGIYFDTTLNKLRVGGATGWETITSV
jgi:hypothetical protein